ncbi:hypothetical protein VTJ83DRAFT_2397 [Remersonia thermophila]|uniref:Secreted protein n=1 Tax=Remersonia thermophila TaxID=72144 RepID=A0ABR4DIM6_9PEZI
MCVTWLRFCFVGAVPSPPSPPTHYKSSFPGGDPFCHSTVPSVYHRLAVGVSFCGWGLGAGPRCRTSRCSRCSRGPRLKKNGTSWVANSQSLAHTHTLAMSCSCSDTPSSDERSNVFQIACISRRRSRSGVRTIACRLREGRGSEGGPRRGGSTPGLLYGGPSLGPQSRPRASSSRQRNTSGWWYPSELSARRFGERKGGGGGERYKELTPNPAVLPALIE